MRVTVVGAGYVGLVSAAGLAEFGNDVTCVDADLSKVSQLKLGGVPIYEPGLDDLVAGNVKSGRLAFSGSIESVLSADMVMIAVGTPPTATGSADLSAVFQVARSVGETLRGRSAVPVVVLKSTVPPGTTGMVRDVLSSFIGDAACVGFNPEFLREGTAVSDFMRPDMVVIGAECDRSRAALERVYHPVAASSKVLVMDTASAELTKYAVNAMLATRISFMNELSGYAATVGADIKMVREGLGSDKRIGPAYLYPGPGYGGSCLPKDTSSLAVSARARGTVLRVVESAIESNELRRHRLGSIVKSHFGSLRGKTVAVWGLAFKADTDDVRESPAITLVEDLVASGARVAAHDPKASRNAEAYLQARRAVGAGRVAFFDDMYDAVVGADALVLCTEWRQYRTPSVDRILAASHDVAVFDGRSVWEASEFRSRGIPYLDIATSVLWEEANLHPVRVLDAP